MKASEKDCYYKKKAKKLALRDRTECSEMLELRQIYCIKLTFLNELK